MKGIALLLLLSVPAAPQSSGTVRLALIEDSPTVFTAQLSQPIERVIRDNPEHAALLGADTVACSFAGDDFRFVLPRELSGPDTSASAEAAALEGDAETAFVYPADEGLLEALSRAAADPATFRRPAALRLNRREADMTLVKKPDGETLLWARAALERRATRRWRSALAVYYRLRWRGRDAAILVVPRTYGGLGRLAAAAEREAGRRAFVGVARGGVLGTRRSDARGRELLEHLERAGLRYSAVAASELEQWETLSAYRAERSTGVAFLSANLVYSSAPSQTVLAPYAVVQAPGLRLALIGLTPGWIKRLLPSYGLGHLAISDPVAAVESRLKELREGADAVVVFGDLSDDDLARLAGTIRGVDLLLAQDAPYLMHTPPPNSVFEQDDRPDFANPFPPLRVYSPALNILDIERRSDGDYADWRVTQSAVLLDDLLYPLEGYPQPALDSFAAVSSTGAALLPSARDVFPAASRPPGPPVYSPREFWTLAAGLLTERSDAEAGLLLVTALNMQTVGAVREGFVRDWLTPRGPAVIVSVTGERLAELAAKAAEQKRREEANLPISGARFALSGLDASGHIRGAPLDRAAVYRLATTPEAVDALGLPGPPDPAPGAPRASDAIFEELRARAGKVSNESLRRWMEGGSLRAPGLWRVNFRDVGINISNTKVVRDDAFDAVPNARIQGFDERTVGLVFKTDLEYLKGAYKWTNTAELEYARTRIQPRHQPALTNTTANRIMLLTMGTRRAGGITREWFARSWGPSVGLQYDGQFEASPGLRRKTVYSVFPGVEFYDGSLIRSLKLAGNIKRDFSTEPASTQTGLHFRTVVSREIGPKKISLNGELWTNYFFLKKNDRPQDLRIEGDANLKLRIPLARHIMVSPFVDFYFFQLKIRPLWGYSAMTGITIGFSRLWKPQYERF